MSVSPSNINSNFRRFLQFRICDIQFAIISLLKKSLNFKFYDDMRLGLSRDIHEISRKTIIGKKNIKICITILSLMNSVEHVESIMETYGVL